jgi:hypothetical protein
VWRDPLREHPDLTQRLANERKMPQAEIPQAAVDQLGRAAGRAGGEVCPLDECNREPVPRPELGDACAEDPAADDEQVERLASEPLERCLPLGRDGQGV